MPEKIAAALGLKKVGIFMIGAMANKDWIRSHMVDIVKFLFLFGSIMYALDSSIKNQAHALDIQNKAIEGVSKVQEGVVETIKGLQTVQSSHITNLTLMEFRMSEMEEDVDDNTDNIMGHIKEDH